MTITQSLADKAQLPTLNAHKNVRNKYASIYFKNEVLELITEICHDDEELYVTSFVREITAIGK